MTDELDRRRYRGVNWKQDLHFCRSELKTHLAIGEGEESVCIAVERFVMHSVLAIRKLLDRRLLSDEVLNATWPVRRYPCVKQPDPRFWFDGTVDLVHYHHIARHYELDGPSASRLGLKMLADQLIHSFVFVVWPRPEDVVPNDIRFFFNSDKSKSAWLYEMHVGEFQRVIDTIVTDEVIWGDINQATGPVPSAQRRMASRQARISMRRCSGAVMGGRQRRHGRAALGGVGVAKQACRWRHIRSRQ